MFKKTKQLSPGVITIFAVAVFPFSCSDEENTDSDSRDKNALEADSDEETDGLEEATDGTVEETDGSSDDVDSSGACLYDSVAPSQVVFIGDSYLAVGATGDPNGIGGIQRQIETRAVADGALEQDQHYRNYYIGGTRFLNNTIQDQYAKAKEVDPDIKVVIMSGGGNDVLMGLEGCSVTDEPSAPNCIEVVERSQAALRVLIEEMQADGVADLIYFFYPDTPISPGHSGYDEPYARQNCESFTDPLECHFVSTIAAFEGHPEYISDRIHPNDAGQVVIGDLLWDSMVENCEKNPLH